MRGDNPLNHKIYNFIDCSWLNKPLLSTNLIAQLLLDCLLLDSVIRQLNKLITYKVVL